jgi:FkbM family methyltransferase
MNSFFGVEIHKTPIKIGGIRRQLIRDFHIDLVIDGGANTGQWAGSVKKEFSELEIWSFEPTKKAFSGLKRNSSSLAKSWKIFNLGLGDTRGEFEINIASNLAESSSILSPNSNTSYLYPDLVFSEKESIKVILLDDLISESKNRSVYLKLDVQGYESRVFAGARKILKNTKVIEFESSFTPLYSGEKAHHPLVAELMENGFVPWFITLPHSDKIGRAYAVDTIMVNRNNLNEIGYER